MTRVNLHRINTHRLWQGRRCPRLVDTCLRTGWQTVRCSSDFDDRAAPSRTIGGAVQDDSPVPFAMGAFLILVTTRNSPHRSMSACYALNSRLLQKKALNLRQ